MMSQSDKPFDKPGKSESDDFRRIGWIMELTRQPWLQRSHIYPD